MSKAKVRVVGIDEWAWRKGYGNYGTIIIDLERREVLDVMQDRTAERTANWFREHPEVEIITRDRCGLYSQGAREGRLKRGNARIGSISCKTSARRLNVS